MCSYAYGIFLSKVQPSVLNHLFLLYAVFFSVLRVILEIEQGYRLSHSSNMTEYIGDTSLQIRTDEDPLGRKIYFYLIL